MAEKSESNIKIIHGYDVDGTLSFPNESIPVFTKEFIKGLHQNFGVVGVLSSGKSASYLENQAKGCHIFHWFAENHAVYQKQGETPQVIDKDSLEHLIIIRHAIGLEPTQEGISKIHFSDTEGEVAIEEGKFGVLTIFPENGPVAKRWTFNEKFTRRQVYDKLNEIIQKEKLRLSVLEPHGDGAIDVVRLDKYNRQLDKSSFASLCQDIFEGNLNLAYFGDGTNDIPAWNNSDVYGVTFKNAPDSVKASVSNKGYKGYISSLNGPEGGVYSGVVYLATEGFYGEKQSKNVELYGKEFLDAYKKQKVIFV